MNSTSDTTEKTHRGLSSNAFVCLVAVFPVVLAALISTVIHASIPFSYIDADTPFASITAPMHKAGVKGNYTASGSIKNEQPAHRQLYIVEESEGKYYPKTALPNQATDWSHNFYAGAPVGTKFRLVVVSIDQSDNQTILDWYKTGENSGHYPGIDGLESLEELSAINLVVQ